MRLELRRVQIIYCGFTGPDQELDFVVIKEHALSSVCWLFLLLLCLVPNSLLSFLFLMALSVHGTDFLLCLLSPSSKY